MFFLLLLLSLSARIRRFEDSVTVLGVKERREKKKGGKEKGKEKKKKKKKKKRRRDFRRMETTGTGTVQGHHYCFMITDLCVSLSL